MARDPKAGLALAGPAGLDTTLHPTEIDIALIGTGATVDAGQRWIENCANIVPGNAKKPRQVPDFPGFSPTSPFKSVMRSQQATQGLITDMDVRSITGEQRYEEGFKRAVDLLTEIWTPGLPRGAVLSTRQRLYSAGRWVRHISRRFTPA